MNRDDLLKMYDFTGKTFVVTGGTGVLGGEVACALAGVGANVVLLDRNLDPAQGIMERMGPHACQAAAVYGDVLDCESLLGAAATINDRFGHATGDIALAHFAARRRVLLANNDTLSSRRQPNRRA